MAMGGDSGSSSEDVGVEDEDGGGRAEICCVVGIGVNEEVIV